MIAEASTDKEEILIAECDPRRIEEVRRNWPFLRDRRIDAYGSDSATVAGLKPAQPSQIGYRCRLNGSRTRLPGLPWPHERTDWPGKFAPIPWVYGDIVRRLAEVEQVCILIADAAAEKSARRVLGKCGANMHAVEFVKHRTNRSWTRDYCPLFVRNRKNEIAVTDWIFNGWAKYDNWREDNKIPEFIAKRLGVRQFETGIVLEGGSIDVNGAGLLLTTEECLLSESVQVAKSRTNPRSTGTLLRGLPGHWTDYLAQQRDRRRRHARPHRRSGAIRGSDTVVIAAEENRSDLNYAPLRENLALIQQTGLRSVALPMPAPVSSMANACPRATRISTSPMDWFWFRLLTTPWTASP